MHQRCLDDRPAGHWQWAGAEPEVVLKEAMGNDYFDGRGRLDRKLDLYVAGYLGADKINKGRGESDLW